MPLDRFHPAVASWFSRALGEPTEVQSLAWPEVAAGHDTLVTAPTGSGKTLAAFLWAIDRLVRQGLEGELEDSVDTVYVSPLKALSHDIQKNLQEPLAGISRALVESGLPPTEVRALVRTGDTPSSVRQGMVRRPPQILVTTPESLYILLTSAGGRRMLGKARTVIVDEIHAVADDKRGSHLALTLERLDALVGRRLTRIGLSATVQPVDEVARFLVGVEGPEGDSPGQERPCRIVEVASRREFDLGLELPSSPLEAVMAGEVWEEIYDRLAELSQQHRTTLVFVNTRRLAERVARHLSDRLGEDVVAAHHGSLSRERRLDAEGRLKSGELRALVATASLELGIDIGSVDLVCQIGSTRTIAAFLQRVGRARHQVDGVPKGRLFPLSRDELVESAALLDAAQRGELDRLILPERPLDILAQQIIACAGAEEWNEVELFDMVRRAWPYRDLTRRDFDGVVRMLSEGFSTRRGRRSAHIHHDRVHGRIRGRRGARLAAMTCGGAIPDNGDFRVVQSPTDTFIGSVNEDFAVESLPGDIFQLGNTSWRILKIEQSVVRVEDAHGEPPNLPFWFGEAPARSLELSTAVSRIRETVEREIQASEGDADRGVTSAVARMREIGLSENAAEQLVAYLAAGLAALGALPTLDTLVLERFFDESGNHHLVVHAPFGSRVNRAWGLALRKRFCRSFNFELQAAATEDALVLSLGPTHSFPVDQVFGFLKSANARQILIQAFLDAPVFGIRWRWNAARALAVLRQRGGRKVPPVLQRHDAEDLLAVVFPDQLACLENITGDREVPDHPLVDQTIRDCLEEAMGIDELEELLGRIEAGSLRLVAKDLTEPSPLAQEILNARPYAFLDDAPLEERRTQAVQARRWLDADTAADLGTLDEAAIARVREEAWPDPRDSDELHDALAMHGFLTDGEIPDEWRPWLDELRATRRATGLGIGERTLWVAAERLPEMLLIHPDAIAGDEVAAPRPYAGSDSAESDDPATGDPRERALVELLRARLEALGPVTVRDCATALGVAGVEMRRAFAALEGEGFVMRGSFTTEAVGSEEDGPEWCERRLLARIHRYTLGRLRQEIQPVSAADYLRFLFSWQRLDGEEPAEGPGGLDEVLRQLAGFETAAAAWEADLLPSRVAGYEPEWLDAATLSGKTVWGRWTVDPKAEGRRGGPIRTTPVALAPRSEIDAWLILAGERPEAGESLSGAAADVLGVLRSRGACFFDELGRAAGLLETQVEEALAELVAWGLVTADGFAGLRSLLVPAAKRPSIAGSRGRNRPFAIEQAGRWGRLGPGAEPDRHQREAAIEVAAWTLLRRYGVIFRRLLDRETLAPPWRELLRVYRRLEARGELRGGRFVSGFSGEQFALPEAVTRLRSMRKRGEEKRLVAVSAADPANLVGIVTPGNRVPARASSRVLFRDGVPLAVWEGGEVTVLADDVGLLPGEVRTALLSRPAPPQLRLYLGSSALDSREAV